jgi:PAS domain S-box-containing protein
LNAPQVTGPRLYGKSAEGLLPLLVQSVRDYAIFLLDPTGHIASWNEGARRIKGYTEQDIIGKHFSIFYPKNMVDIGWPDHELAVAAVEGRFEDEGWRVRKDGSQFWADIVITALRDESGELRGFAKVTRDLTERKMAEEALRQSEERHRLLIDAARDYAIFMLDPEGHVITWNRGAERLKGYRASEIIGKHFSIFYPPETAASGWAEHELEMARKEGSFEDEGWRVRKDGSRFWANVVLSAVYDEHNVLQGFSKITHDISERKRYEEATRKLNEELRARVDQLAATTQALVQKNQELETFVYSVSHDVRGPLVNLQGFNREIQRSCSELSELIQRNQEIPSGVREAADRIIAEDMTESTGYMETAVGHLGNIIDSLLRISRAGRVVYSYQIVDVAAAVRRVLSSVEGLTGGVRAEISIGDLPPVLADPAAIEQIFNNLLSNALRYRDPSRRCRIEVGGRTTHDGAFVEYYVKDNGLGIPKNAIPQLFTTFHRFHPDSCPGEGMGLVMVRRIIERLGGTIRVEPNEGEGVTFVFELPSRNVEDLPKQ